LGDQPHPSFQLAFGTYLWQLLKAFRMAEVRFAGVDVIDMEAIQGKMSSLVI
jgi:hypothetical protein